MIEGLHADITSAQLIEILDGLIKQHSEKTEYYQQRVAEMEKLSVGANEQYTADESSLRGHRQRLVEHKNKVAEFKFMRDHTAQNETFRLDYDDLRKLEIVSGHY